MVRVISIVLTVGSVSVLSCGDGDGEAIPTDPTTLTDARAAYYAEACKCWGQLDFGDLNFESEQECRDLLPIPGEECVAGVLDEGYDTLEARDCRMDQFVEGLHCMRSVECSPLGPWQECDQFRGTYEYDCPLKTSTEALVDMFCYGG